MAALASPNGNGHTTTIKPRIVATYDYRDEQGTLLYQAVRLLPKDFRQRKPDGSGGWTWKLGDVRRVLYRLPELIAADHGEWVLICEGEKDADRLAAVGWVTTTNCAGAGKWRDEYNQHLAGRRVAILPDNDKPGRDHAAQVAASLQGIAAEVKVVELPGLTGKGDVTDWLDGGGTQDQLDQLILAAEPWTPAAERSFFDQVETAKKQVRSKAPPAPPAPWVKFPIESFPEPIRSYVTATAEITGTDPAFAGTAVLPCLAGAVGISRALRLRDRWIEPSVLWCGIVGPSGSGKSPALDQATYHVKKRQAAAFELYGQERKEHDQAVESFRLAFEDWKKSGRKKNDPQPEEPIEPICRRLYVADVTTEALGPILAENGRGVLLCRDELSAWFNSHGEYKKGHGSDVEKWLSIHGCRDLLSDRKTGDNRTVYVRRAAVSIVGGVQPGTLRRVLDPASFESGLAARWLFCCPPRRQRQWTEARIDQRLDQAVEDVFGYLYGLEPEIRDGHLDPVIVDLTPDGKREFVGWYNQHGARLTDADGAEAALLSKCEAAAARLALVIHLCRQVTGDAGDAVDGDSIRSGITLAEWFAAEGLRLYAMFSETDDGRQQRELIELITRRGGTVTPRDLMRSSRKYSTADQAEAVLQDLVSAGLGSFDVSQPSQGPGRPVCRFTLADAVDVDTNSGNTAETAIVSASALSTGPEMKVADEWEEVVL
jgi:hypothetical protein